MDLHDSSVACITVNGRMEIVYRRWKGLQEIMGHRHTARLRNMDEDHVSIKEHLLCLLNDPDRWMHKDGHLASPRCSSSARAKSIWSTAACSRTHSTNSPIPSSNPTLASKPSSSCALDMSA